MNLIVFIYFLIGEVAAIYFENVKHVDQSEVEIILTEESPSLLSCSHKCLRLSAEVNFDPPRCTCFVYKRDSKNFVPSAMNNGILSGLFYQVGTQNTLKRAGKRRNNIRQIFNTQSLNITIYSL